MVKREKAEKIPVSEIDELQKKRTWYRNFRQEGNLFIYDDVDLELTERVGFLEDYTVPVEEIQTQRITDEGLCLEFTDKRGLGKILLKTEELIFFWTWDDHATYYGPASPVFEFRGSLEMFRRYVVLTHVETGLAMGRAIVAANENQLKRIAG